MEISKPPKQGASQAARVSSRVGVKFDS
jgi:hypothetical protein